MTDLHMPCVYICTNKRQCLQKRYEVHLSRAPVTDVRSNVKHRLRVTRVEGKRERGRDVIKEGG